MTSQKNKIKAKDRVKNTPGPIPSKESIQSEQPTSKKVGLIGRIKNRLQGFLQKIKAFKQLHPRKFLAITLGLLAVSLSCMVLVGLTILNLERSLNNKENAPTGPNELAFTLENVDSLSSLPVLEAVQAKSNTPNLDKDLLADSIKVSPESDVKVTFDKESHLLTIQPTRRWDFRQNYSITIPRGKYGEVILKEDFIITFTTSAKEFSESNSLIWVDSFYNSAHEFTYYITQDQQGSLKFKLYKGTLAQMTDTINKAVKFEEDITVDLSSGTPLSEWSQEIDGANNKQIVKTPINEAGIYILDTYDRENQRISQNFIVINKYAVSAQVDRSSLNFFAESLENSQTIKGVEIEIFDVNSGTGIASLGKVTTNTDLYKITDKKYLDAGLAILKYKDEYALLSLKYYPDMDSPFEISSYIGSLDSNKYTYFDKPYYYPNDILNFKTVIRERVNGVYKVPPTGTKYKVSVKTYLGETNNESEYSELLSFDLPIDKNGTISGSVNLNDILRNTTDISLDLFINDKYVSWINVNEFEKPDYVTEISTNKSLYKQGETIVLNLKATTYAGNPLTNGEVSFETTIDPSYSLECGEFTDRSYFSGIELGERTIPVGSNGAISQTIKLDKKDARFPGTISITGDVSAGLGSSEPFYGSARYFPADYTVLVENHQYTYAIGQEIGLKLSKFNPDCSANMDKTELSVSGTRTTYIQEPVNDARRFTYREEKEEIPSKNLKIGTEGTYLFSGKYDKPGYYLFTVLGKDSSGRETANTFSFSIAENGSDYYYEHVDFDPDFQVLSAKEKYEIGDNIEISVKTNGVRGKGWMTLQGGEIMKSQLIDLTKDEFTFTIPYEERFLPNAAITLSIFAKDKFLTSRADIGYNMQPKNLSIEITPSKEEYKPGEEVTLSIETKNGQTGKGVSTDISINVIDKALLDAYQYGIGEDIFNNFWQERSIYVDDYNSLSFSLFMDPGGMGDGGGGDGRTNFPDNAFWQANVATDGSGMAEVKFNLPDNITKWAVLATGNTTDNQFGFERKEFIANLPLAIEMNFPEEMKIGDQPSAYAYVSNNTDQKKIVSAEITTTRIDLDDTNAKKVTIPAHETRSIKWNLKTSSTTVEGEDASVTVKASSGDLSDAITLPTKITQLGYTKTEFKQFSESFNETVAFADPVNGKATLNIYPSYRSLIPPKLTQVITGNCESNEARASRLMANSFAKTNYTTYGSKLNKSENELLSNIRYDQTKLYLAQNEDGGWGWWRGSAENYPSLPEVSAYVMIGLFDSNKLRVVPQSVRDNGVNYIQNAVGTIDTSNTYGADKYAITIFALSKYSKQDISLLNKLDGKDYASPAALSYMAMAAKNSGQTILAGKYIDQLLAKSKVESGARYWENPTSSLYQNVFYNQVLTNANALALQAILTVKPTSVEAGQVATYLLRDIHEAYWSDNLSAINMVLGLHLYVKTKGITSVSSTYKVLLNDTQLATGSITDKSDMVQVRINKGLNSSNKLELQLTGSETVYSDLAITDSTTTRPDYPIKITREIFDSTGKKIEKIKLGQNGIVKLKITVGDSTKLLPAKIDEPLAAGLEAKNYFSTYEYSWIGGTYYDTNYLYSYISNDLTDSDLNIWLSKENTPGTYYLYYKIYAVTPGIYNIGPSELQGLTFTSLRGNSDMGKIEVTD